MKDRDSDVHADPEELGQFLEKHRMHPLIFTHEHDAVGSPEEFPDDWPRFKKNKLLTPPKT